jgi:predicted RND superfamily exporter protein
MLLCLFSFRSVSGTLAIMLPLGLVSLLCYALMALLEIGLKVSTLLLLAFLFLTSMIGALVLLPALLRFLLGRGVVPRA